MRVCKFGGAATRDAAGFERIREIVAADRARQVIVPSAPEIRDRSQTARIHASMILAVVFYRYTAVRPALLPDGKRGYRAAIQGLHALSLASRYWLPMAAISGAVKYSMFSLCSPAGLF